MAATPTGTPLTRGCACCSARAKLAFMSMCMTVAGLRFIGKSIGDFHEYGVQRFGIDVQEHVEIAHVHAVNIVRRDLRQLYIAPCTLVGTQPLPDGLTCGT